MVTFTPARPVRAYERVVEQIEDAIAAGSLPPGSHLPSERDLVTQFAVSRATVREALRVLESGGLVRSRPGDPRGPQVLAPSADGLRKTMTRLARLDALSTADLVQFRMVVDASACRLAARTRTERDLVVMRDALATMRGEVDAPQVRGARSFADADAAFHAAVAAASGNELLRTCGDAVRTVTSEMISGRIESSADASRTMAEAVVTDSAVYAAIERGDGGEAADLVRRALVVTYAPMVDADERALLAELL